MHLFIDAGVYVRIYKENVGLQTIAVGYLAQSKQTSLGICDAEAE